MPMTAEGCDSADGGNYAPESPFRDFSYVAPIFTETVEISCEPKQALTENEVSTIDRSD